MKNVVFIVKGTAKKLPKFHRFFESLNHNLFKYQYRFTEYPMHAEELAIEACKSEVDVIVAVGGDGSLNEVLNGLMKTENSHVTLAHLPLGTANDFAKSQNIKLDVDQFQSALNLNLVSQVDVGILSVENEAGQVEQRHFINILGFGLGGHVVDMVDKDESALRGKKMKFFKAISQGMFKYQKPDVMIKSDSFSYQGPLMMLAVCNSSDFGSGLTINPFAKIDNGQFNVTLVGDVSIPDYIQNYFKLKNGKLMDHPNISYHTAEELRIVSNSETPCPIELDGEFVGYLPATVNLKKAAVRFLRPV